MNLTADQKAKLETIKAAGEKGLLDISSVSADSLARKGLVRREVEQKNVRATQIAGLLNCPEFNTRFNLYTLGGKLRSYTLYRYTAV